MKKILTTLLLVCLVISGIAQTTGISEYYLARSKKQKSAATVMLIGGAVTLGLGVLIGNGKEATFEAAEAGGIIGGLGVLSMLGSIPLYIAADKNKTKAAELMVGAGRVNSSWTGRTVKPYVSVGVKVPL